MNHLVMIADIIGSRKLDSREVVQSRLEVQLDELNTSREQLLSPYTITLGDEFQAVFDNAERVFPDLLSLMSTLHPVELRFALGIGPISTTINARQAIGMDGPAFYRARDLLDRMKKQDLMIAVRGLPEDDGLLDAALGMLNHQLRKWRPNRLDVLRGLLCELTITEIAGRLDISEQSVYKNIRDGELASVIKLIHALTGRMNSALSNAN